MAWACWPLNCSAAWLCAGNMVMADRQGSQLVQEQGASCGLVGRPGLAGEMPVPVVDVMA
jgi:hypothetical protein